MSDLLIKNVPEPLRRRLKEDALKNHRSMSRHALALMEKGLMQEAPAMVELEKPFRLPLRLTNKWLAGAKRQGRE